MLVSGIGQSFHFSEVVAKAKFGQSPEDVKGWHTDKWMPVLKQSRAS